jgi:hypothetical protein
MADELTIVLPVVQVYGVEYSNSHEKCPPKLNVINSFHFCCYFIFGSFIEEYYSLDITRRVRKVKIQRS